MILPLFRIIAVQISVAKITEVSSSLRPPGQDETEQSKPHQMFSGRRKFPTLWAQTQVHAGPRQPSIIRANLLPDLPPMPVDVYAAYYNRQTHVLFQPLDQ